MQRGTPAPRPACDRLRGEGRGEGACPRAQTRGKAPSPGAQGRADLSPPGGGGGGCGEFEYSARQRARMMTTSKAEMERKPMQTRHAYLRSLLLAGSAALAAFGTGALAAEVTPQRLVNADKEPQNWLMNHRTYDGQRFSPLDKINKGNVKGLKIA